MEVRKLTPEQIDDLYKFCEEHDVKYYDLQIELVDHLAAAIEENWLHHPELSFKENLCKTYNSFGRYGFIKIVDEKADELKKKYKHLQWQYIGEFYSLPKIILTVIFSLTLFSLIRDTENFKHLILYLLIGYFVFSISYIFIFYRKYFRFKLINNRSFLQIDLLNKIQASFWILGFLPTNLLNMIRFLNEDSPNLISRNIYTDLILSFSIVFFGILMIAEYYYVPKRIKADFTREFPQFVKS